MCIRDRERLLRAIFGEKAREVRDTSLKVPHGAYGIIVDAKVFTRENGDEPVSYTHLEETQEYDKSAFDYMDVSPKMVFSVATAPVSYTHLPLL